MRLFTCSFFTLFLLLTISGCNTAKNKAKEHYFLGKIYEQEGKIQNAVNEYRSAVIYAPDNIHIQLAYQNLMVKLGNKKDIVEYYQQLKELNPLNPSYQYLSGLLIEEKEERKKAFEKALSIDPNFIWALNSIGLEYLNEGSVDEAIKKFNKVIVIDSEFPPVHINLCRAYLQKDKINAAYNEIKKYLELEPESSEGYIQLGYVYQKKGDSQKAIEAWQKSLELTPGNVQTMTEIGHSLLTLKKYDQALSILRKAEEISPGYPKLHYILSLTYDARGETGKAINELRISLSKDKKNAKYLETMGILLAKAGNLKEGKKVLEDILKSDPDNLTVLLALGKIYEQEGNFNKAQAAYSNILKINPHFIEAQRNIALLLATKRDIKSALNEYNKLMIESREMITSIDYFNLGLLQWETGNLKIAQNNFLEAIRLNPYNMDLSLKISLTGEMKGLPEDASKLLKAISRDEHVKTISNEYLGAALLQEQKYDDAIKVLSFSVEALRMRPTYHMYIALALSGKKKYTEALNTLKKAITLVNGSNSLIKDLLHCIIGHVYVEKGALKSGIAELKKAQHYECDPLVIAKINYEIARIYGKQGITGTAIQYLNKSAKSGFCNYTLLKKDIAFEKIRMSPEFIKYIKRFALSH